MEAFYLVVVFGLGLCIGYLITGIIELKRGSKILRETLKMQEEAKKIFQEAIKERSKSFGGK